MFSGRWWRRVWNKYTASSTILECIPTIQICTHLWVFFLGGGALEPLAPWSPLAPPSDFAHPTEIGIRSPWWKPNDYIQIPARRDASEAHRRETGLILFGFVWKKLAYRLLLLMHVSLMYLPVLSCWSIMIVSWRRMTIDFRLADINQDEQIWRHWKTGEYRMLQLEARRPDKQFYRR